MQESRIAVKSFIVNQNRLLIVKRSSDDIQKPDLWELPGGRLEIGEDPRLGLQREIKEETNLDVDILHTMNCQHFTSKDNQTITMLIFLCKPLSKEVTLSHEHSDYEWIDLDECKNKLAKFFHPEVDIYDELQLSKLI